MADRSGTTGTRERPTHDGPTAPSVGPSRRPGRLTRARAAAGPLHVVMALWAAVLGHSVAAHVNDLDSYWHVLLGRQILQTGSLDDLGRSWLGVEAGPWATSQWLSEVAMAAAVDAWGWQALVVGRDLLVVAVFAVLVVTLAPRRPVPLVLAVLTATALLGPTMAQDRPQTVSFVFLALLGAACVRLLDDGRPPPPLVVAGCCLLWAQLHGLWVLAPAAFALVAVGVLLDGPADPVLRARARHAAVAAVAALAGLLNPLGLRSLTLPLELRSATSGLIAEWMRTSLSQLHSAGLLLLVLLIGVAWARTPGRVPRVELLWGAAWGCFALLAHRNVTVAALMLAPAAMVAADRAWGDRLRAVRRVPGRTEGALLVAAVVALTAAGPVLAVSRALAGDPLETAPAVRIAERLAREPAPVRVFNAYNPSGVLAAFGGGQVRLVVDGRADLWGAEHIERVLDAQDLADGWERTVRDADPDVFVLPSDAPLVTLLTREGDWRVDLRDGDYVLLVPTR